MRWFDLFFASIHQKKEQFARQYRYEPPPEFSLNLPCSSIIHLLFACKRKSHSNHFQDHGMYTDTCTHTNTLIQKYIHMHISKCQYSNISMYIYICMFMYI